MYFSVYFTISLRYTILVFKGQIKGGSWNTAPIWNFNKQPITWANLWVFVLRCFLFMFTLAFKLLFSLCCFPGLSLEGATGACICCVSFNEESRARKKKKNYHRTCSYFDMRMDLNNFLKGRKKEKKLQGSLFKRCTTKKRDKLMFLGYCRINKNSTLYMQRAKMFFIFHFHFIVTNFEPKKRKKWN